ncbi:MAG: energy-coupling factor ABC transporter ATP-binding protein [Roseburia sp.]|nr:energy-coupling factor ABC transporter ATP-binding protein [Roseburia sp.]
MSDTLIELEKVSFGYVKERLILRNLDFRAGVGESVGIVGANGAGKSTLLRLLVGLEGGYEGRITVDGITVEKKNLQEVRRRIGYVFQDADSQMFLSTVGENVAFGPANYGCTGEKLQECVTESLQAMHIEHLAERPVYQLSGGEKKLASLATVLSMKPDILILDEPTVALDPRNRRNLAKLLNSLPQVKLIASHDLDFILDTCERTLLLHGGHIVKDGKSSELLSDRRLMEEIL